MPVQKVNIETFLELASRYPVIDVRSPGEYIHAQIPGAYSLPLFTDEERKVVGTAYKQQGKQTAIKIGLELLGKKMVGIIEEVERLLDNNRMTDDGCKMTDDNKIVTDDILKITDKQSFNSKLSSVNPQSPSVNSLNNSKTVLVHCWRGGMRSGGVAWLLDLYGFKVYTLAGGYKFFRQWVLKQFEQEYNFKLLGGFTGSGKTEVLQALKKQGERVIDLEELANHKGSAFGNIGLQPQPSQEMFENKLALELWKVAKCKMPDGSMNQSGEELQTPKRAHIFNVNDTPFSELQSSVNCQPSSNIWLEDESQRIGSVNIPNSLWTQIRTNSICFIKIPFEERLDYILQWYGKGDKEKLITAIVRIKKRLGGLETKTAINFLLEDNLKEAARVLLAYYDKWYLKGLQSRENWQSLVTNIECEKVDPELNARKLLATEVTKMNNEIKLTQFSHGAGCGCKIAPQVLDEILKSNFTMPDNNKLLVGNHSKDDAAAYDLGNGTALISTTDFFMPIVDDPFDFGRIASANAISDVFAMGGKPILAIAILGWPIDQLSPQVAQKVIEGSRSICSEASIPLAGGHSIDSKEPIFGLAVSGLVDIKNLKKNSTAKKSDLLFITKKLGVGILSTAQKRNVLKDRHLKQMVQQMTTLNKVGEALGKVPGVNAMTDVTGFGLLGHLIEMAEGSGCSAELFYDKVLLAEGVKDYAAQQIFPGGTKRNWNSYGSKVSIDDNINSAEAMITLPDPQTNGGLLIAVEENAVEEVKVVFEQFGLQQFLTPIGRMTEVKDKIVIVTNSGNQ